MSHPETLTKRAMELLRIPSVIGNEAALADYIEAWATKRFSKVQVQRISHSFIIGRLNDARPSLALVGHLDTVPGHEGDCAPHVRGDRLVGLGASDMKGALAVMMALVDELALNALPVNLLLLLYEREEGPFQESGLQSLLAAAPVLSDMAFAVAMEPTDSAVQMGCVGSLHATLSFEGQAAHSARPWQGENAIHKAWPVLADLHAYTRRETEVEGLKYYEVMSATQARGGQARNVVANQFALNLNYRFAPGKSLEAAKHEVLAFVRGRAKVHFTDLAPSGRVVTNNAYAQRLVALSGKPPQAKQAWTDVARLTQFGVDAVNYGPGETQQAHQRNESVSIAALVESHRVLSRLLCNA